METLLLTLKDAVKVSGFSRSRIYALAGQGKIEARKAGRRTMIVAESLRDAIGELPPARISAPGAMTRKTAA